MINPEDIYCNSSLHDSCGVVFEYEGRVYRALYERGVKIFELLSKDNWMDFLAELGLVRMHKTDLHIPGYNAVIECERMRPIIPPPMWTISMLREAALSLCEINKELLLRGLVIWDLKGMANITFSAQHGPVFMDLGAIHRVDEIENRVFSTSPDSLFEQIASSFYAPLWLAHSPVNRIRFVRRLLEYHRAGEVTSSLTTALLRRLTIGWKMVPGLLRTSNILRSRDYAAFYESISKQIKAWNGNGISKVEMGVTQSGAHESMLLNVSKVVGIMNDCLGGLEGKVLFDLCPQHEIGLRISERCGANVYLITKQDSQVERSFGSRKIGGKPILPVICDIWDRSLHPCYDLKDSCDLAYVLPSVIDTAAMAKVPMDFMGRVLSLLTRNIAVVGIRKNEIDTPFTAFVSPPASSHDFGAFCRKTLGKYFKTQEVITLSETPEVSLLILRK
jgi:hypothetical protein